MPRVRDARIDDFEGHERQQFELAYDRLEGRREGSPFTETPAAAGALKLLRHSPEHALALWAMGTAIMKQQDKPGTWTAYEHEWIDEVLALDAGHYALLDIHLPLAVAAGLRLDAIEALRDHHEEDLTDDERQIVSFIRGVRDGNLSDDVYAGMRERLGSDRGVVEYAAFVLNLNTHVRLMQAFDLPTMTREDLDQMIAELRTGARALPDLKAYTSNRVSRAE